MESKNKGFTVVELLTAVAIVALLIGLLLPAVTYVRNTAKETMQKAQLATIELALTAFKNDYGDYPPSDKFSHSTSLPWTNTNYCGAQKLAEALLGWDLLGFHPKSAWRADGMDIAGGTLVYASTNENNLKERKGPYLELASANAFTLRQFLGNETTVLNRDRFMLCDVFGVKKITLANGATVKAGTPILYYRANTSSKTISDLGTYKNNIYDSSDNYFLINLRKLADWEKPLSERTQHPLEIENPYNVFYGNPTAVPPILGYIQDPKVTAPPWPYRPDSYILISAGVDGLYGTKDDITNF